VSQFSSVAAISAQRWVNSANNHLTEKQALQAIHVGEPHLFGGERALMDRTFEGGCRRYLEFGLGGSTLLAIRGGAETVVAVDSDPNWVAAFRTHPEVAPKIEAGSASVQHADIGPVGAWGVPFDTRKLRSWPTYISSPWADWSRRGVLPDLVYVDGRFRVACCLSVIVAFGARMPADGGPRVLLHDVTTDRPHYGEVFRFFDTVESVNTLHLLRTRPDACRVEALARLLEYQLDPR
jgi:hypothetical protein